MSVRAAFIATGTELLTGQRVDRNGPWVAEQLAPLGVDMATMLTVGDRAEDLESALRFALEEGMDLVVTSGGLGPTADDLTAAVLAAVTRRELVLDPELEQRIAAILARIAGRRRMDPEAMAAGNRKQATVPAGAAILEPAGTAPGLVLAAGKAALVALPGPPGELQAMWPAALETAPVRDVLGRAPAVRTGQLRIFGIPESSLAKELRDIGREVDLDRLEITTCLHDAELVIDTRYDPADEAVHRQLVAALAARYARHTVSTDGATTDEIVARLLAGRTLAVAESCTGGLLAGRLTDPPGASAYLAGGVVAYSNQAKHAQLGVDPELIAAHGAVSTEVAEAMAAGALQRFDADTAVAVTGIAGPGGGTQAKPVGYVCFCGRTREGRAIVRDPVLPGGRRDVRERSVVVALHVLRHLLAGTDPPP